MVVKLNPRNELAKLFNLDANGYVLTASDVGQKLKDHSGQVDYSSNDPFILENLAPSFGDINNAGPSVKGLDDKMKYMIVDTMKQLLKLKNNNALSWDNIQRCFNQNTNLVAESRSEEIVKQFTLDSSSDFKFDGSADPSLVQKVMTWWESEACPNPDIRNDSNLDIKSLANIVAWSGATITDIGDVFYKHEHHERTVFEIGVMRYPSTAHPYFRIYRIKLHAWSDCSRTLWHQDDSNGIESTVTSQTFGPNDRVLNQVTKEATKQAASEIDDMF